jgi:hypothetical protein
MTRRTLLTASAGLAAMQRILPAQAADTSRKLKAPAEGKIPVAFPISEGAVVIDYCGPWEVFQDTQVPSGDQNVPGFETFTVAETLEPVTVSGGMKVIPNYTFATAPAAAGQRRHDGVDTQDIQVERPDHVRLYRRVPAG